MNPSPAKIRTARQAAGLTQTQAGALVHVTLRTWQRWESDKVGENKPMPAAAWELFLIKTGQPERWTEMIKIKNKRFTDLVLLKQSHPDYQFARLYDHQGYQSSADSKPEKERVFYHATVSKKDFEKLNELIQECKDLNQVMQHLEFQEGVCDAGTGQEYSKEYGWC